jgi:SET domain-containing protein
MTADVTDEFSFLLRPSHHGVGVFAAHDIAAGTFLRLFGDEKDLHNRSIERKVADVPAEFQTFCMHREDTMICPRDFSTMAIGWYLNHSLHPNAIHRNFDWYAARDIKQGEEILIDYNTLEEPEAAREAFYKGH